jgi:hypothetical protein
MSTHWIVPNWHFSTNLTEVFLTCFVPQLHGKWQGLTRKDGTWSTFLARKAAKFYRDNSNVNFKHDHSGFEFHKAFQPKLCPIIGLLLLEQWSSVCPCRDLQPRREIVTVSEIPVIIKVSDIGPSDAVTQEWLNWYRDVVLRFRLSLRPHLALWLVLRFSWLCCQ